MFIFELIYDLNRNSKSPEFYKFADIYEDDTVPQLFNNDVVYNNTSHKKWGFKTLRECLDKIADIVEVSDFVVVKNVALYDFESESIDGYQLIFDPKIINRGEDHKREWNVVFRRQRGNDIYYN